MYSPPVNVFGILPAGLRRIGTENEPTKEMRTSTAYRVSTSVKYITKATS